MSEVTINDALGAALINLYWARAKLEQDIVLTTLAQRREVAEASAERANGPEASKRSTVTQASGSDEHQPRSVGAPAKGER